MCVGVDGERERYSEGFTPEVDQQNALKHWLEDEQTVKPNPKGEK